MNFATRKLCQPVFALVVFFLAQGWGATAAAATTNTGSFVEETIGGTWNEAVGLTFSAEGQMFVWERAGRVWVVENGVKQSPPLLDISEEVGSWHDHGLMSMALHPDFLHNGYFYVLYVVDHYYLANYGTPSYNSSSNDFFRATIGRITRYTARTNDHFHSTDPSSRRILLGETNGTGFPILYTSHGLGSLVFGEDGTLFASCGDGGTQKTADMGSESGTYYAQGIAEGIIQAKENVGSFRAQMTTSLAGKIVRLDPATGDGIPSNPFYDSSQPRSARSRLWALGLRQPFRFTLRPGTGSHLRGDGRPGVLYIGDVGWLTWEELDVCTGPGMNFGWPLYEGLEAQPTFSGGSIANQDAPNPLNGVGGCNRPFFYFKDLLRQATLGAVSWPNPCDPSQQVPGGIDRFVHSRPVLDWKQPSGPARTGIFNGTNAAVINVGATASPVAGPQFAGNCSIGGIWYTNSDFPSAYQNTYFHGDYGAQWIKNIVFDENNRPVEVRDFWKVAPGVVFLATHPVEGSLYYISWTSTVRKIHYVSSGNLPPVAVASLDKTYGPSPFTVQFIGTNSIDPEGRSLGYRWDFGDGSAVSTNANPVHTFTAPPGVPTRYDVTLTVTDALGASNVAALIVSANNTPPLVSITSPVDGSLYPTTADTVYDCTALVSDAEQDPTQLSCTWQTILHHNNHTHEEPPDTNCTTSALILPVGCDGETYYYSLILTVTDSAGLSTTNEARLYPDCQLIVPGPGAVTNLAVAGVDTNSVSLVWTAPGTNGGAAAAAVYDLRYSPAPIFETNWDSATQASGEPAPGAPGTTEAFTVTGLSPGVTYWFGLKAADASNQLSPLSNVATATTRDALAPPVASIAINSGSEVALMWNAAPGKIYRVEYAGTPTTNVWTALGSDVLATNSIATTTDALGNAPQRFYRVLRIN